MSCPHVKDGRCALAELLAARELGVSLQCPAALTTCNRCQSWGEPTEETPTIQVLGLVMKAIPPERADEWKRFASAVGSASPHQSKPQPARKPTTVVPQRSRGLGDTVAKITKAFGIEPCGGCQKRQEWLNKVVPYRPPETQPSKASSQENPPASGTLTE